MKTKIIYSNLFKQFPELVFGFSTKVGGVSPEPYCLNLSISVGDDPENVKQNREIFFNELGINKAQITFQKQIHSTIINYSEKPQYFDGCDAIYTDKKNNYLSISSADCIPVFLFEPQKKVVAAIHSGWKGTYGEILSKTIEVLIARFGAEVKRILAFIGPGISQKNYPVENDVGDFFVEDVKIRKGDKIYLDLKKSNYDLLIRSGLQEENIEVSDLCTYEEKDLLHSFRRDREKSGRMFGVIGIRNS